MPNINDNRQGSTFQMMHFCFVVLLSNSLSPVLNHNFKVLLKANTPALRMAQQSLMKQKCFVLECAKDNSEWLR